MLSKFLDSDVRHKATEIAVNNYLSPRQSLHLLARLTRWVFSDVSSWLIRPRPDISAAAAAVASLSGGRYLIALQVDGRSLRRALRSQADRRH